MTISSKNVLNVSFILRFLAPFLAIVVREIAILAQAFGVILTVRVLTFGCHADSPVDVVAVVAHALCIVLHVGVWTVGNLSLLAGAE